MKLIYFFFPILCWIDNIDEETKPSWKKHLHELFKEKQIMTLKQKFQENPVVVYQESFKLTDQSAEQFEKIADAFAIGFAEWVWLNAKEYMRGGYYSLQPFVENVDLSVTYTISELLEIYKKEKGYV